MELKGFSRYAFTIKGNELIVRNKESRKIIHPSRDDYHFTQKYRLVDDNGNAASVAELRIAYCLLNHCDLTELKGKRLKVLSDNQDYAIRSYPFQRIWL